MALCGRQRFSLIATVSGDLDLGSHDGQLMARMLRGLFARKESDDKSRRIRRKHEEIALAGRSPVEGLAPTGTSPTTGRFAPPRQRSSGSVQLGSSPGSRSRSICIDLNDRGVPTVRVPRGVRRRCKRMLVSARISGQREHKGAIVANAEWAAIITPAETERLRAKLRDPARRTNRSARRYLLPRLLRCGHCGEGSSSRARARRRLVAMSVRAARASVAAGRSPIVAEPLELFTVEAVLHRLDSPELAASLERPRHDGPRRRAGWQTEIEQHRREDGRACSRCGARSRSAVLSG